MRFGVCFNILVCNADVRSALFIPLVLNAEISFHSAYIVVSLDALDAFVLKDYQSGG